MHVDKHAVSNWLHLLYSGLQKLVEERKESEVSLLQVFGFGLDSHVVSF